MVGFVAQIAPTRQVQSKTGSIFTLRSIQLVDDSSLGFDVTLWNESIPMLNSVAAGTKVRQLECQGIMCVCKAI